MHNKCVHTKFGNKYDSRFGDVDGAACNIEKLLFLWPNILTKSLIGVEYKNISLGYIKMTICPFNF